MSESGDAFESPNASMVEEDRCKTCKETIVGDTVAVNMAVCYSCHASLHLHCLGIAVKGKRPTAAVIALISRKTTLFACEPCADAFHSDEADANNIPRNESDANNIRSLAAEVQALKAGVNSILAVFGAPKEVPMATKAARKSFASITAKNRPDSGLIQAVSTAVRHTNEEELRQRSLVIDGVPMVDGECDREKINNFISYCGLNNTVRVTDIYRMGVNSALGRAPKIKLVVDTTAMQHLLLEKRIRDLISSPNCPPDFAAAFFNPSRTWEERRVLMKLRKRRNELNVPIKAAGDKWFLDYKRGVLVKRVGGEPEWVGPGDVGWEGWESEWEKANPPSRGRLGAGEGEPSRRATPPSTNAATPAVLPKGPRKTINNRKPSTSQSLPKPPSGN